MKVTVCFGAVRVVVPCGCGDLLVRDLIIESIRRYKKATGKNENSWVVVHHLQSQSGILDPDDRVQDVADDREQILASYDDHPGPDPPVPQGGGDGASGSSVGTGSPDIFRVQDGKYTNSTHLHHHSPNENTSTHIDVTENDQPPNGLTLQVRRGSEPSLLTLDENTKLYPNSENSQEPSKRWSAAPLCRDEPPERLLNGVNGYSPKWTVPEEEINHETMPSSFTRSGRLSMQFLGDGANYRWIEAAEKAAHSHSNSNSSHQNVVINDINSSSYSSKSLPRDPTQQQRKEPLGQANVSSYESIRQKKGEMLLVTNEAGGPLGLTAIPDRENGGLLVHSVEPESRADKGKLRRGDRILEINGLNLMGLTEASVQDQLKKCIASSELRLRVIRARNQSNDRSKVEMFEAETKGTTANGKVAQISPTRKPGSITTTSLQVSNTRKLGRRIEIILKKGVHGLGFSVTTRDNPAGGECPIYIKNILPKGAAIEDGRLKPGDRLLEVDNVTITGKSQSEVVNILRGTQPGAIVRIVVSRQQEIHETDEREIGAENEQQIKSTTMPKQPPPPILPKNVHKSPSAPNILDVIEKKEDETVRAKIKKFSSPNTSQDQSLAQHANIFPWRNREILTLNIPVHDSEKAGLGVSVKGKTGSASPNSSLIKHDGDLGIFIKSVLHGGAASRDGRLKMNDQLLSVNGISLLGQSNADAMDTLRRAMLQTGGNYPGVIVLKVARRASSRPNSTIENGHAEQHVIESSGTTASEQSGSTVIYLSPNDKNSKSPAVTPPSMINENGKRWSNPVLDRLTGGTGSGTRPSTLIQMPGGLRNDSYYMATNDNWSPSVHLNNSNGVLIEEDPEPTSPHLLSMRPDLHHQLSASTPTSAGDITYDSQLSLENPVDAFSRDAVGRRSMSEKHHAALDAKETGTYQRNKKIREERGRGSSSIKSNHHLHSSIESLTNVNRIGSMKTRTKTSDLRAEAMDKVSELGPTLGMKKSSSLESLQTMVQEIQMSDEPRGPNALRAPRGRGREEVLRAAVERPEQQPRKHWLLEDGTGDRDGGFQNRGPLQSSTHEGKSKDQKKGFLKGIGHMFRFGKHRKDVYPAQTEVITDYTTWSNDTSVKSATLGPSSTISSPASNSNTSQAINQSSNSHHQQQRHQREASHERTLSSSISNGPPSYHAPPGSNNNSMNGHINSKIAQNDAFNHRYSHYVNYDELQLQISETPSSSRHSRNKLIVTKHPTQQQHTKSLQSFLADEQTPTTSSSSRPSSSGDGENLNDLLSDSMIEKLRLQVRLQREKVEDESRRNHHYHSQRSARNVDLSHYHPFNGVSPVVNGHKYPQQQPPQHHQPQSLQHHMRPISSYYEYETINPNGHYRKLGEQFVPLQNSNSSSKIVNGTSSVRITGNSMRAPIPDMKNHRGPFITQVHIRDPTGKHHPSASKV